MGFVLIGILVWERHISAFDISFVLLVHRFEGLLVDGDISFGDVNVLFLFDFLSRSVFYLCNDIDLLDFYNAVRMERGEGFLPSMVVVRGRKSEWTIPHAIKKRVYGNKEVA